MAQGKARKTTKKTVKSVSKKEKHNGFAWWPVIVIGCVLAVWAGGAVWSIKDTKNLQKMEAQARQQAQQQNTQSKAPVVTETPTVLAQPEFDQLTSNTMRVQPSGGKAPVQVTVEPYFMGLGNHWIDFGDASPRSEATCIEWKPDTDACLKMDTLSHLYITPGVYTVRYIEEELGANGRSEHLLGEINIVAQ